MFASTSVIVSLLLPIGVALAQTFSVCHRYNCYCRTKVTLSAKDERRIQSLLKKANRSAGDEREVLRIIIALFEEVIMKLAERVGFEPTMELPPRRISSAVLSTTQPPLRCIVI